MAACGASAGDGPGGTGAAASRQQQGLWRVRPHVRRRYPLRVPRPGNLLSTLDRRWVATVVVNRDMGPIARVPSLGELPAAVLDALPAPRTPLDVADVPHNVGLPRAHMQHALLCMAAAADGGMSMLMTVSLQHVQDAMQQQRMHAPQPWEESAKRSSMCGECHMRRVFP